MKKYVRILLVAMISLMVLALAGCGEEEKYNKEKAEVLSLVEQVKQVNDRKESKYFSSNREENDKLHKAYENERVAILEGELKKRQELYSKIDKKLIEMAGYAKGDGKLEADLSSLKKKLNLIKQELYKCQKNIYQLKNIYNFYSLMCVTAFID